MEFFEAWREVVRCELYRERMRQAETREEVEQIVNELRATNKEEA